MTKPTILLLLAACGPDPRPDPDPSGTGTSSGTSTSTSTGTGLDTSGFIVNPDTSGFPNDDAGQDGAGELSGFCHSGCFLEPRSILSCENWCFDFNFGPCAFIETTQTGSCEPPGSGLNQLGLCGGDPFVVLPPESTVDLSFRCFCVCG